MCLRSFATQLRFILRDFYCNLYRKSILEFHLYTFHFVASSWSPNHHRLGRHYEFTHNREKIWRQASSSPQFTINIYSFWQIFCVLLLYKIKQAQVMCTPLMLAMKCGEKKPRAQTQPHTCQFLLSKSTFNRTTQSTTSACFGMRVCLCV